MSKIKKTLAAIALVGSVSLVAACGGEGDGESAAPSDPAAATEGTEQGAAPTADLSGIPDVVATVNGEEITKDEFTKVYEIQFQQMAMQAQMSGQQPDQDQLKKSVAESLVGTELLVQRAAELELTATEEQISEALTAAAESNQMSEDEFLKALEKQGTDRESVDQQLKQQVEVEAVIEQEVGEISASEDELKEAYEQQKSMQEQMSEQSGESAAAVPEFEEVKDQLEQQVVQQKENEATQQLVDQLRSDGEVEVKL
ncbi:SurA N-terminal domain-containing protein [Zhihengliuella somnathii]